MLRVAQLMYLMLPAYLANMAPPFVRYWPGWNPPISGHWLGDHKTLLGFSLGVLVAILTTLVQAQIDWTGSLVPYTEWPLLGLAFGVGAMGGDSAKSFVKRRMSIAPGAPWIPVDQLDFVAGALLIVWPWASIRWPDVGVILVLSFFGDIAVNHAAYWMGIRDTRW
jgi:CDP-2,3-bis-(O-geranylgeranyl)-sn-glycerol synthase